MPLYVGETVEVTNSAKDFDGVTALTPALVATVSIEIVDPNLAVVVSSTLMTWDVDRQLWVYKWDTTSATAQNYQAKVTMTGADGSEAFAYSTIRLKAGAF